MEEDVLMLPALPAGTDSLSQQLYSEQHIDAQVKKHLAKIMIADIPKGQSVRTLILGGRCGLTAQIFLAVSSEIDILEEEPFVKILKSRFEKGQCIDYFFGSEGDIGERYVLQKPLITGKKVRILTTDDFSERALKSYDVIVLQNCIISHKFDIAKELLNIQHSWLKTMIVPGKVTSQSVFDFIAKLQKKILMNFYDISYHERLQDRKHITGRKKELIYYEIFGWKKREFSQEDRQLINSILKQTQSELNLDKTQIQEESHANRYETQKYVQIYLNYHYGPNNFDVENYPSVCAQLGIQVAKNNGLTGRALDLGCAVGRAAIDLAEYFEQVVGIDLSQSFIKAASQVLANNYELVSHKVKFIVGNACSLDPALGKFSLVFGQNLIDHLSDPTAFLNQIVNFLEPNGVLILTSSNSWLAQFTSKDKWLGGFIESGVAVTTQQGIRRVLSHLGFKQLRESQDIRFAIKQNEWVYQYTQANATFWRRKNI